MPGEVVVTRYDRDGQAVWVTVEAILLAVLALGSGQAPVIAAARGDGESAFVVPSGDDFELVRIAADGSVLFHVDVMASRPGF